MACAICPSGGVHAQGVAPYPAKTVRIIVGSTPGGGPDIMARAIAQKLGEAFAQTVIVDDGLWLRHLGPGCPAYA